MNSCDYLYIGRELLKAQEQCFRYEKQGTPISEHLARELVASFHDDSSAMLYEGTTEHGFKLAMKVMKMSCCTPDQV